MSDSVSGNRFNRRFFLLLGAQLIASAGLARHLYRLQVEKSADLQLLGARNRYSHQPIAPIRRTIFDRNGVELATAKPQLTIVLLPHSTTSIGESLERLAVLTNATGEERRAWFAAVEQNPGREVIPLIENADWDAVARTAANAPALPEFETEERWIRDYPEGQAFAHVIGYVGRPSANDINRDPLLRPLSEIGDVQIGKAGIERGRDRTLRGWPGTARYEVDARGHKIRALRHYPARPGSDLVLTLDRGLQRFAFRRLGNEVGAVVAMNVQDGGLRCLVSKPGFDPNLFTTGIRQADWQQLLEHEHQPLVHRALDGEYSPGSTYKIAVALAALEAGVRTPRDRTACTGVTTLGNHRFHCWNKHGHGAVDMREAIKQSCDTYFYWAAHDVGIDRIADMSRRLGLGEKLDFGLRHSRHGIIPTEAWKRAVYDEPWQRGDSLNAGIGQGYVLVNPIQLAVMTARVANGVRRVSPNLVIHPNAEPDRDDALGIADDDLEIIRDALFAACNEPRGTAFAARPSRGSFTMAGKTGTTQVRRITEAEREGEPRKLSDIPWKERNHALFVGFAPVEKPQLAVAVIVEHGGSGAEAAAPVARDVLHYGLLGRAPGSKGQNEAGGGAA